MSILSLPWLEYAIGISLLGALVITRVKQPERAYRLGVAFTATATLFSTLACLAFYEDRAPGDAAIGSVPPYLFGRTSFRMDGLSAPMVPLIALIHCLMALATNRTIMRR